MWSKIKAAAVALVGIAIAIGIAFIKGRRAGLAYMEAEQQRKRDVLQQRYDEIDGRPLDPGSAYDRLRDRAKGGR